MWNLNNNLPNNQWVQEEIQREIKKICETNETGDTTHQSSWDGSVDSTAGILSRCICISNHHILHFKYITFIFVNYMSIKL